ncbi:hypothetical protein [Henriciella sp.]|uniref:hypothetical protein n=1 Tax=Henriciella sp. TaxID=1968823 RepID=UPI00261E7334|nr:hypothetical protein [Henriciella sp.]
MLIRRLAGLVGICVAAWMLWQTIEPIQMQISRGSDLITELLNPPTSLMRLVSTALMIVGGLLALAALPGGAWLMTAGAAVFAAMTGAMAGSGADSSLWSDEAVLAPFLLVISGVLVFRHRK